jgi:hypothetical protein
MVTIILLVAAAYLAAGILFSVPFITRGVTRIDEGAAGSGFGFRLIIIPGVIVFWPLLLKKWMAVNRKPLAKADAP